MSRTISVKSFACWLCRPDGSDQAFILPASVSSIEATRIRMPCTSAATARRTAWHSSCLLVRGPNSLRNMATDAQGKTLQALLSSYATLLSRATSYHLPSMHRTASSHTREQSSSFSEYVPKNSRGTSEWVTRLKKCRCLRCQGKCLADYVLILSPTSITNPSRAAFAALRKKSKLANPPPS